MPDLGECDEQPQLRSPAEATTQTVRPFPPLIPAGVIAAIPTVARTAVVRAVVTTFAVGRSGPERPTLAEESTVAEGAALGEGISAGESSGSAAMSAWSWSAESSSPLEPGERLGDLGSRVVCRHA
ncbi:hypothetical protein KACC15558_23300 [Brevibacterium ammoniilyticum]|uniref:Uncharacterized protein n=1 Tax=Brevibacterium ammoniilyticum TaxID=1046555 RepID=A0ABP9U0Z8_9MICO